MLKKLLLTLLVSAVIAANVALADAYNSSRKNLHFEYDKTLFKITTEDSTDDELLISLDYLEDAWGKGYISIYLRNLEDGESVPTLSSFSEVEKHFIQQLNRAHAMVSKMRSIIPRKRTEPQSRRSLSRYAMKTTRRAPY